MKYNYVPAPTDTLSRKTLNEKVLYLIDSGTCDKAGISQEDIYNAYTGDGGLHGGGNQLHAVQVDGDGVAHVGSRNVLFQALILGVADLGNRGLGSGRGCGGGRRGGFRSGFGSRFFCRFRCYNFYLFYYRGLNFS